MTFQNLREDLQSCQSEKAQFQNAEHNTKVIKRHLSCQNTTHRCQKCLKTRENKTDSNSLKHMRSFLKRRHQECLSRPFLLISSVFDTCGKFPLIVKSYLQNQSRDCEILRERTNLVLRDTSRKNHEEAIPQP